MLQFIGILTILFLIVPLTIAYFYRQSQLVPGTGMTADELRANVVDSDALANAREQQARTARQVQRSPPGRYRGKKGGR